MRIHGFGAVVAAVLMLAGCSGQEAAEPEEATEIPVEERESIADFDVEPLDPAATEPCALITAEEAESLGIETEQAAEQDDTDGTDDTEEDDPRTEKNCHWTGQEQVALDLRVDTHTATDRTAVWHVIASGMLEESKQELVDIAGYPATELSVSDRSCNVEVAVSDEHYLQAQSDDPCEFGRRAAETAIGNTPQA